MAEVLLEYRTVFLTDDGRAYRARACGAEARDRTSRWHAWIEFVPLEDGPAVRTDRETTQPDRTCAVYWSTGLTPVYLEGALERALRLAEGQRAAGAGGVRAAASKPRSEATPFDRWFLKSLGIASG